MSGELHERGCGKATMYVITEKGLEIGPFVYNRDTDSRVLCANTPNIYYNQEEQKRFIKPQIGFSREINEKRKLKIVNLSASSLPSRSIPQEFIGRQVRDMENWGLMSGNFRSKFGLKSGKHRQCTAELKSLEDRPEDESNLNLEIIKHLLKTEKDCFDTSSVKKSCDLSLNGKRQIVLRRLKMKRQSQVLRDEIARLRETKVASVCEDEEDHEELESEINGRTQNMKLLKHIFYSQSKLKVQPERVLQRLHLPSIRQTHSHNNKNQDQATSSSREKDQKLLFLTPRIQYDQAKAVNSAKMKLNECKLNENPKPKVRFPAVIDQRTGEIHTVPGAVTFQKSDYNRWSRRENIIRKEVKSSRSPSLTYVSFLPSVAGDINTKL